MIGTVQKNFFHRIGDAWSAFKGVPVEPGMLYPPQNRGGFSGYITFPGYDVLEREGADQNERDLKRAKLATTSPWVFADVQAIANEFSTAELVVKERKGDKLEDVENHPLERIWESPNEHMGRSFVASFWAWSYVLASKAFLYWVPNDAGEIEEVWPVPPWMIRPVPDPQEFIRVYAFKSSANAEPKPIPAEYITYSHSVNLFDIRDGLSFLASAMNEVKADLSASSWNLNFFDENNGLPDGFLGVSKDTLDTDLDRIRSEIRDFFGGAKRGIAVGRSGDLAYTQFGRSQKDMEFSQGRELASKIIGRTLGFPDGYWSDLANRANAEQARKTMISGAVWPLLVRLAEDMNARKRGIVQRWYGEQFRVEFKDIRPEDRQLKMQEQTLRKDYWLINELREADGKDPLEDVRGLMLIAEINKGAPTPGSEPAQEIEDQQAAKAEEEAQKQAALVENGQAELPPEEGAAPPPEAAGAPVEGEQPMEEGAVKSADWDDLFASSESQQWLGQKAAEVKAHPIDPRADDLRKWEAKALKSLKRFHKASVPFESLRIPLPDQERISAALKAAETVEEVKAAFKAKEEDGTLDALLDDVDSSAREWANEALSERA